MQCTVENCPAESTARGLCMKHYLRLRRHGSTEDPASITVIDRFMSFVEVDANTGAWLWRGGITGAGYGAFWVAGKTVLSHRFSYENFIGPIPDGMFVCHKHESLGRHNVNPEHLFLGDHADNMRDAAKKGRTLVGSRNPQAKLNDEAAIAILESSSTLEDLAANHRISVTSASKIVRGHGWRHLGQSEAPAHLPRHNKSGFRGVSWVSRLNTWRAAINATVDGKRRYIELGRFSDPKVAARAYDDAARHFHGKKAITNF